LSINPVESLEKIVFLLNSRGFSRAHSLSSKALTLLKEVSLGDREDPDYKKIYGFLLDSISELKKCVSMVKPGDNEACVKEARRVYRYSLLLNMISTGRIRELVRARRAAYASVALGLPTAALFGLPVLAIGLIFLGLMWTYFYFVRMKLIGFVTLATSLVLLLPYLINAVMYFTQSIFSQEELASIASELEVSSSIALLIVGLLLAISSISLVLNIYALVKLFKYRIAFE